jgi:hypothetical protein
MNNENPISKVNDDPTVGSRPIAHAHHQTDSKEIDWSELSKSVVQSKKTIVESSESDEDGH